MDVSFTIVTLRTSQCRANHMRYGSVRPNKVKTQNTPNRNSFAVLAVVDVRTASIRGRKPATEKTKTKEGQNYELIFEIEFEDFWGKRLSEINFTINACGKLGKFILLTFVFEKVRLLLEIVHPGLGVGQNKQFRQNYLGKGCWPNNRLRPRPNACNGIVLAARTTI